MKKKISEVSEVKVERKIETVPTKLGSLIIKKKSNHYEILRDKKLLGELYPPFPMGNYFMPVWGVWRQTINNESILEEVFSSLDSALSFIQKKFSKK